MPPWWRRGPETAMSPKTKEDDALSLLGLARRAGAVEPGLERSRDAIGRGGARLLLTAHDASTAQLRKVIRLARHRDVPRRILADRSRLGRALGGPPVSAAAVTSESFAHELLSRLAPVEGSGTDAEQRR